MVYYNYNYNEQKVRQEVSNAESMLRNQSSMVQDQNVISDVQARHDGRRLSIQQVGVRRLKHPVSIVDRNQDIQQVVASCCLSVALPSHHKGAHMSRFVEVMRDFDRPIGCVNIEDLLFAMLDRLGCRNGRVELAFIYMRKKSAPISGVQSYMDYEVVLSASNEAEHVDKSVEVHVPVTSLCPCSKEISNYGAHNQRSIVSLWARPGSSGTLMIEDLIDLVEAQASCGLYGILKRPDEKHVTERAYENPKFVEDMVRDLALELDANSGIDAYRIVSENFESIHNHSAYASIHNEKNDAR